MTTDLDSSQPVPLEPEFEGVPSMFGGPARDYGAADTDGDEPLGPINWNLLTGDESEAEWLDRDRPTRQIPWPGEEPNQSSTEVVIEDREADFVRFVLEDVAVRRRIEARVRQAS